MTAEDFVSTFKNRLSASSQQNASGDVLSPRSSQSSQIPKPTLVAHGRKSKTPTMDASLQELVSPPKKQRGKSYDQEISNHHLGIKF